MKYEAMERFVRGVEETTSVAPAMPLGTAEFLAEALEGAGFGTWHLDMETGLTTWDAIASKILGYEEVVHTSGELGPVHPDDQARLRDETARCLREGKPYDVQFRGVRADGEIRWLRASAGQPKSQEGKPRHLAGIVADITAKKEADDKLRQAEERHLVVSRAATDLVYEWDIKTGILQWNDALSTYFQHRAEDVSSNVEFFKKLHPDERVSLSARIDGVIDGGGSQFSAEHRLRRADGSYGDVHTSIHVIRDASGGPVRVIGTMHDITERKRADAALRDSEAVNRSIVEASTDVIKLLDLEGRLIFMNGSGADALAIKDLPQFYGSEWAALWPLAARRAVREAVTIANQGGIGRFSEACPTVLGEHRCWDVVVSPVFGGEGGPTKLVAISRDITDRIEAAKLLTWSATHDSLTELPNRAFFSRSPCPRD